MQSPEIWFWQNMLSPHMAGLATALARAGRSVSFVAEQAMTPDRAELGWQTPDFGGVHLHYASNRSAIRSLVGAADTASIHICQGVRGNGSIATAQQLLRQRGLRQWVVMETVQDSGWRGVLKRLEYRRLFRMRQRHIDGVLAAGHRTVDWVVARGVPVARVFPFAYFLPDSISSITGAPEGTGTFRFIFVGQLIERKRLDLLIRALASLPAKDYEVVIVGSGPLESTLRAAAEATLSGKVNWIGRLPASQVPDEIAKADCLVLPSRRDGWGAVISEALLAGTPVLCSDTCGAAGAVLSSGVGGVFPADDVLALRAKLVAQMSSGRVGSDRRRTLAEWARCIGASAGARYLMEILDGGGAYKPTPPWETPDGSICAV